MIHVKNPGGSSSKRLKTWFPIAQSEMTKAQSVNIEKDLLPVHLLGNKKLRIHRNSRKITLSKKANTNVYDA